MLFLRPSKKQPLKSIETISMFYKKQCTYNPQMRKGFKPYNCKQGCSSSVYQNKSNAVCTNNNGDRYPLNFLEFKRDKNRIHPTQKPIPLMEYLVKTYTNEGETVLDFTMGSCSTGVACVNTNRNFIGIELDKKYFDISIDRIKKSNRDLGIFKHKDFKLNINKEI